LPSDLTLRVYADGVTAPSGESFYVDCIEVFPTYAAQNASLVRAPSTEEPESYDGVTGIQRIAENNGQGIRAAFTLRNNLYFAKERSLYVIATDGVNEPALWQVSEVSNKVGTPSAHGIGYGEEWVVIAGRTGLYYFDGSEPVKLSQEIQPTWDAINWQYGQRLWVQVDTQRKRILVGAPMSSATQPSQVLVLDYTEGLQDPLVAVLRTPERGRKWATWTIAANSCRLIERSTSVAQIFLGSNNSSGKIYSPVEGQYSDDGVAINSFYSIRFLAATGLSGRNLFGYLTGYVQGAGSLALSAILPGSVASAALGAWTLGSPASRDMEQFTNVLAERVSYRVGTNAVGAWFALTQLVPWAKADPFAVVRGTAAIETCKPGEHLRCPGTAAGEGWTRLARLEDDAGQVVMASLARLTCEMYLLMNRNVESAKTTGNPRESYARLLSLHKAAEQDLLARGLDDAHAWLPPPIAKRFGRRLTALGWVRDDVWTPYCFRLRANQK
jgi:hypothetical protein